MGVRVERLAFAIGIVKVSSSNSTVSSEFVVSICVTFSGLPMIFSGGFCDICSGCLIRTISPSVTFVS